MPVILKLSSTRIRFLKPKKKISRLADGGGLSLEIHPSGSCLWRYRYRIDGKENVFAIGSFPEMSLKAAREARDEARKLVERGIHPAHQRRAERVRTRPESPDTFGAVAREWLEVNKARWSPRSYRQRTRLLEREVLPGVSELPMSEVTAAHFHGALKRIAARAPHTAVLARQCVGAISRFGIATQRSEKDLSYSLRAVLGTSPRGRGRRQLSEMDIPKFFEALRQYRGYAPTRAAIRLLWLTLARPTEVMSARWEEFDLPRGTWSIPPERMSPPGPHAAALPEQAVELLKRLREATGDAGHLIPNRFDPSRAAAQSLLIKAMASMGYGGRLTPYGIRLTGRTILVRAGYPRDVLERQLGYANARSAGPVAPERARREMVQWWADYLDSLCSEGAVQGDLDIM